MPAPRHCLALAVAAALGGCEPAPDDTDDLDPGTRDAPIALAALDGPDPERCQEVARRADALIASAMTCTDDLDCEPELGTLVSEDPCLPHLGCWLAVSTHERVELDVVLDRLQRLDAEYRDACGICPVPTCADPDLVFATCERSGCAIEVAPPPDDIAALSAAP